MTDLYNKKKGVLLIILAAFSFALMGLFVKLSGNLPSIQKGFFRNFVAMLFSSSLIIKNRKDMTFHIGKENYIAMLVRCTAGTVGIIGNFYAVSHLLIADASLLNKLAPFVTIIFSAIFLKEIPKKHQIISLVLALVGTIFVVKPGFENTNLLAMSIGILGGIGAGLAYTMVRLLGTRGVKGAVIVFYFSSFSCLAMIPLIIMKYHQPMSLTQIVYLLGAGIAASIGQFSVTFAYKYAPAKEISVFDFTQIVFSAILGYFVFKEIPDLYSFLGYFIIIGASLLIYFNNKKTDF